jgi:UDP-glucose 4-epimerase
MDVRRSIDDPGFDATVNIAGTANMLEAARLGGAGRFVLASTGGAIYGEGDGRPLPLGEDEPSLPLAPYGQSKLAAEGYVSLYRRLYGVDGSALRLGNVYGPRQDPFGEAGVVAIFCGKLLAGERPRVYGSGRQTRDYVYVGDVVRAFLAAGSSSAPGPINVGTGRETSVLELVALLVATTGRHDLEPELAEARKGEVERISIDPSLAARELDWQAETALEDGLRATLSSFAGETV